MLLLGKTKFSMGHGFHSKLLVYQRVDVIRIIRSLCYVPSYVPTVMAIYQ